MQQLNQDIRLYYPTYDSIEKVWLGSIYINKYPVLMTDKQTLEREISTQLISYTRLNGTITLMSTESYYDTINSIMLTRVNYKVK